MSKLCRNTPDLNTSQSILRLNNFITYCLGHSKLLYVLHRYTYLHSLVLNNASSVCVIKHGRTFEKQLLFSSGPLYNMRKNWNK